MNTFRWEVRFTPAGSPLSQTAQWLAYRHQAVALAKRLVATGEGVATLRKEGRSSVRHFYGPRGRW